MLHAWGNLKIFPGATAYNAYGHFLKRNPMTLAIEAFLGYCVAMHSAAGMARWLRTIGFNGQLTAAAGSGLVVLCFLVYHVWQMRSGHRKFPLVPSWVPPFYRRKPANTSHDHAGVVEVADIYDNQAQALRPRWGLAAYLLGIGALGWHLFATWPQAVYGMGLSNADQIGRMVHLGQASAVGLTTAFASVAMYSHWSSRKSLQSPELPERGSTH